MRFATEHRWEYKHPLSLVTTRCFLNLRADNWLIVLNKSRLLGVTVDLSTNKAIVIFIGTFH